MVIYVMCTGATYLVDGRGIVESGGGFELLGIVESGGVRIVEFVGMLFVLFVDLRVVPVFGAGRGWG